MAVITHSTIFPAVQYTRHKEKFFSIWIIWFSSTREIHLELRGSGRIDLDRLANCFRRPNHATCRASSMFLVERQILLADQESRLHERFARSGLYASTHHPNTVHFGSEVAVNCAQLSVKLWIRVWTVQVMLNHRSSKVDAPRSMFVLNARRKIKGNALSFGLRWQ